MADNQFIRSEIVLGNDSSEKLKNSDVIVFGLGGVGSYVVEVLARSGIGKLTLVDNDRVSLSNLNRQLCALHSTLGMYKTDVTERRVLDINPDCSVKKINLFYLPENADSIDLSGFDYIVDAIDTVSAKLILIQKAKELNIPIISCMGTGNKLDASQFRISDIYSTSVCPLCRIMRSELRKRNIDSLDVLWSPEKPVKKFDLYDEESNKNVPGSLSFVPGTAGLMIAGKIIRYICGI